MVKKRKIGKIVFNWKGYKLRHVDSNGGKLAVYKGKNKQIDFGEFGTLDEGIAALKTAF